MPFLSSSNTKVSCSLVAVAKQRRLSIHTHFSHDADAPVDPAPTWRDIILREPSQPASQHVETPGKVRDVDGAAMDAELDTQDDGEEGDQDDAGDDLEEGEDLEEEEEEEEEEEGEAPGPSSGRRRAAKVSEQLIMGA